MIFTSLFGLGFVMDVAPGKSAWNLIMESGLFAKIVLLILIGFSVISWAIIFWKWRQFSKTKSETSYFLGKFRASENIRSAYASTKSIRNTPFVRIFKASLSEWEYCRSLGDNILNEEHFKLIRDAAERAGEEELSDLGGYIPFLATTANSSPFLGLLGTVWGIMGSFSAIGARGSASLAVVAPGIAEALIATVAGLAAAIPAVIAYNHFNNRLRTLAVEVDNFKLELLSEYRRENLAGGSD